MDRREHCLAAGHKMKCAQDQDASLVSEKGQRQGNTSRSLLRFPDFAFVSDLASLDISC
jgi:hypothetical protein